MYFGLGGGRWEVKDIRLAVWKLFVYSRIFEKWNISPNISNTYFFEWIRLYAFSWFMWCLKHQVEATSLTIMILEALCWGFKLNHYIMLEASCWGFELSLYLMLEASCWGFELNQYMMLEASCWGFELRYYMMLEASCWGFEHYIMIKLEASTWGFEHQIMMKLETSTWLTL